MQLVSVTLSVMQPFVKGLSCHAVVALKSAMSCPTGCLTTCRMLSFDFFLHKMVGDTKVSSLN
jgi:hypothetical protein